MYVYFFRVLTSIRGTPQEYDIEEPKLRQLEKLLGNIEGKLMEGMIFKVSHRQFH